MKVKCVICRKVIKNPITDRLTCGGDCSKEYWRREKDILNYELNRTEKRKKYMRDYMNKYNKKKKEVDNNG